MEATTEEKNAKSEERAAKLREAVQQAKGMLKDMSDLELDLIAQICQLQLDCVLQEKAKRAGIEAPYVTIIVSDQPFIANPAPVPESEQN